MSFVVHGCPILDCDRCGHRFAEASPHGDHVSKVYGDHYFSQGGAGYSDYHASEAMLVRQGRRYASLIAPYIGGGRLLDVGAAGGYVLQGFCDAGWEGVGIEPNASMAATGQEAGRRIVVATAESLPASALADEPPFDLVAMIQVIAQFHDIRAALGNLAARTRDDGWWLIESWNCRSLTARLQGRRWHEYSPPSVLHWFTPERLAVLLKDYGFTVVARGRPPKALLGSNARSLLRYKLGDTAPGRWLAPALAMIPAGLVIPYPGDDVFWMLCRRGQGSGRQAPVRGWPRSSHRLRRSKDDAG